MTMGTMTNLTGTTIMTTDKKSSYIVADRSLARQAYPWCVTSTTTSYFLQPSVNKTLSTKDYIEYSFEMDENYDFCKQILAKKQKSAAAIARMCNTPFYSFMIAVSDECHEAIMSVLTVQMYAVENVAGKNATEMYAHAHKGHDTGVPLLKYLIKPSYLKPASTAARAQRHFTLTMRINKRTDNKCQDLKTLCGGDTCMVALSDEEYNTCPAFYSKFKGM
ncbi:hypothetical protein CHLRE_08g368800v5 [Chlamydomonas reinhardtii]|uniref:Uncharacterized protein n=1 Tax=Chlamydomonas reinhardtii TaxID=3055 RepID=A0A2K3DH42_CHLRE|nr:uncharacterized protein CHLRE_08g368800v5 [Chlamydomonas reinhardtii]XP_042921986.1 uncharacterized protein CHLRE_08g368800v5 [Chlamydomonas reinhardtii]PNW79839.1 hypothetical protein CHLRE_08g368800v5 [Chlamydomonas reinhardtii]PNW79840.1 hypothetical protein CHLRE_08g368800v5 [Chlamydomonas reinhardtii]